MNAAETGKCRFGQFFKSLKTRNIGLHRQYSVVAASHQLLRGTQQSLRLNISHHYLHTLGQALFGQGKTNTAGGACYNRNFPCKIFHVCSLLIFVDQVVFTLTPNFRWLGGVGDFE